MEKIYESVKMIITRAMSIEMVKLATIFTCAMVAYWVFGANILTSAIVAFLAALCPVIYTIGLKKGDRRTRKLSVFPAVIAAVIIICGNGWALLILAAQAFSSLLFVEPAALAEEMDNMD